LEALFLHTYTNYGGGRFILCDSGHITEADEEALFKAFSVTLDLLRDIHIAKGENLDQEEVPTFTKRVLQTT
jgi:hypothetical protein